MEALEAKEQITQRELAKATGLNLKKVNYCLHKLLEKGHVKFEKVRKNPDKRAYLYILTPAGMKLKSELTYRFLKFTLGFYEKVEVKLRQVLVDMVGSRVRRVLLFGASDAARIVIEIAQEVDRLQLVGVVDSRRVPGEEPSSFHGLQVVSVEEIETVDWDGVLITDLDDVALAEGRLKGAGVDEARIWRL